jgi:hypothetical protein
VGNFCLAEDLSASEEGLMLHGVSYLVSKSEI